MGDNTLNQITLDIDDGALSMAYGNPTDKQLEKINQLAKRPLSKEEVFVFPDKLVGDMIIPNRYIKIHKSLLNVFKEDAKKGISLLIDHPWAGFFTRPKAAIAYGRTFDSVLKKSSVENEEWELLADHYIVRGKEIDGIITDSIISSIEDGTFFDTSIGWGADTYECSICGNDYRDYSKCDHFAGREYDSELCYVIAKPPGFVMENSIVFDGAYPGAGALSNADDSIKEGKMVVIDDIKGLSQGIMLFHTYSARKGKLLTFARRGDMEKKVVTQGITLSKGGEKPMDGKILKMFESLGIAFKEGETEDAFKQLADKWESFSAPGQEDDAPDSIGIPVSEIKAKLGREVTVDDLLRLAKEGDDYLQELQKEAKEWGVRAKGDKFNAEAWEVRFKQADSAELKSLIETFKEESESAIPAGRQTEPGATQGKRSDREIPDDAYKA